MADGLKDTFSMNGQPIEDRVESTEQRIADRNALIDTAYTAVKEMGVIDPYDNYDPLDDIELSRTEQAQSEQFNLAVQEWFKENTDTTFADTVNANLADSDALRAMRDELLVQGVESDVERIKAVGGQLEQVGDALKGINTLGNNQ